MRGTWTVLLALLLCLLYGCASGQKAGPASPQGLERRIAQPAETGEYAEKTASPVPAPEQETEAPAAEERDVAAEIEAELLRLINRERGDNGVEPLGLEEAMRFAARIRAEEALTSLSHTRPDETPYQTALSEAGFAYAGKWHGENLAILIVTEPGYSPEQVASALFREYVASPGHHSNILSEHFAQTGIGIFLAGNGDSVRFGAAQMFAGL